MSYNFKKAAKEATTLSPLLKDREKIDTDALIESFPDGVTIDGVDVVEMTGTNGEKGPVAIVTFKEDPTAFYFGGYVLTAMFTRMAADFPSIEALSDALKEASTGEGALKVKLTMGKTKNKKQCVNVEVVE